MKGKHMPKLATPKQKLNISITSRMKRRIQDIAKDKGISMNDLVVHALQDFIDRSDGTYQNADLVADRLNQVLNSQMAVINQLNQLSRKLDDWQKNRQKKKEPEGSVFSGGTGRIRPSPRIGHMTVGVVCEPLWLIVL